jgi:iron complex transport system substrate-binding protein
MVSFYNKLKIKIFFFALIVLPAVILVSCRNTGASSSQKSIKKSTVSAENQYARCFSLEEKEGGYLLSLTDPWREGRVLEQYWLQEEDQAYKNPEEVITIKVPVETIVASSTTHAGFMTHLDADDLLMGMNNPERLYDSVLYDRYLSGELLKMGRDLEYNLEYLISAHPSVILQTGIDGQFKPDNRLLESGIPVLYILEWMESTPLGRAEWIKVFGVLTGRGALADSLFAQIEDSYLSLCAKVDSNARRRKVFTGTDFKGTWYVPGGRNYLANFFQDAGLEYPWASVDQSASLALSFEAVHNQAGDAPLWIGVAVDSISQLLAIEKRYANFRAVQEKQVYTLTHRVNLHGGNDYWEGGVVRPDQILADLIAIAWPEQLPEHRWNFIKPLIFN